MISWLTSTSRAFLGKKTSEIRIQRAHSNYSKNKVEFIVDHASSPVSTTLAHKCAWYGMLVKLFATPNSKSASSLVPVFRGDRVRVLPVLSCLIFNVIIHRTRQTGGCDGLLQQG